MMTQAFYSFQMHFLLDITHAAGKTKLLVITKVEMLVLNCQSEFNIYKHAEYTAKGNN